MTTIEKFIQTYTSAEDSVLAEMSREVHVKLLMPRMLSGHVQGKILEHISRMLRPMRILEIGTFTGYSAICLAKGLRPDGILHTIEINDERETFIRKYLEKSGNTNRIQLHIGDALEIIKQIDCQFDLVFIDGDKREYPQYFETVIDRVPSGGYILADNIFWDNKVLDPQTHTDSYTHGILDFLELTRNDKRVEPVVLPLRDGLLLMRRI